MIFYFTHAMGIIIDHRSSINPTVNERSRVPSARTLVRRFPVRAERRLPPTCLARSWTWERPLSTRSAKTALLYPARLPPVLASSCLAKGFNLLRSDCLGPNCRCKSTIAQSRKSTPRRALTLVHVPCRPRALNVLRARAWTSGTPCGTPKPGPSTTKTLSRARCVKRL